MQINLFVFDRSPQPFNKHIVPPGALAVHADADAVFLEQAGEGQRCELAALVQNEW